MFNKESLDFLERFMKCSSPSGYEVEAAKCYREYLKPYCALGTTVIGQFNTRASEFRMNFVPRTYDLKGRNVGEGRKARGVYLKK